MIKAGILGCGKIADQHAAAIGATPGCRLVGVCDSEELMARQLYERYPADYFFSDVDSLLDAVSPGVVHITTPPQSHFELGMKCLEAGCSVYMEKPFTVTAVQARRLIDFAEQKNLKITAGHNAQFSPAARAMRELVAGGWLGGQPEHLEGYYCYSFGDKAYAQAVLGDRQHWVRRLPGQLLHNIICHGISKIAEFMPGETPLVVAHGYTSRLLESMGEDIIDELRVIIHDPGGPSAYFTFSSQMSPTLHQLRVYGPKNGFIIDDDTQTLIELPGRSFKSYLNYFLPPLLLAKQYAAGFLRNAGKFLRNDFNVAAGGMGFLTRELYRSIQYDSPPPIPYREILLTATIMDSIFDQLAQNRIHTRKAS